MGQKFIGEWSSTVNNSEINSGVSTIIFEKAYEKKSKQEALALEIKNKEGNHIDSWLKILAFTKYQLLIRKIHLSKKTFEITGQFLTDFEKGEIFDTKSKQDKCVSIINMTFPLIYVGINVTTLTGNNIYLGLMPINGNQTFTMKLESKCGIGFVINARKINIEEENDIKKGQLMKYFFLCLFSSLFYGIGILFMYCGIKNNEGYLSSINIEIFSLNSIWNFYYDNIFYLLEN